MPPPLAGFILGSLFYAHPLPERPGGAGKTRALVRYADRLARKGLKTLIVQPTKDLIDNTVADELEQIGPSYPVTRFHGGRGSGFVVGAVVQHLRQAKPDQGEIVFITHEAFIRLPYVHRPDDWVLLFDEVPAVDVFDPYELPVTHALLTNHLGFGPARSAHALLRCRDGDAAKSIGKIADNEDGDVVLEKLQPSWRAASSRSTGRSMSIRSSTAA